MNNKSNSISASEFMDKQIMDLSRSQSNNDFIDFMNSSSEDHHRKKDDIVPSYDFMPIRHTGGSGSSPPQPQHSSVDSGGAPSRAWNSADSKAKVSSIRNYGSLDGIDSAKVISEEERKAIDSSLVVSEIDKTMKKYADSLMHAVEGISARLSQLETRTRHVEDSVDDLKMSVGNNHGSTEGKMRQLENILREVQNGVGLIKDKQEIMEAQMRMAKLQVSKAESVETHSSGSKDSPQLGASAPQSHPQLSTVPLTQSSPAHPPPNAPPPPPTPSQQGLPPQVQVPNQFSQNPVPSVPQRDSYFPPPGQSPENINQQYQMPQPQQQLPPSLPQQQFQTPAQPQYSPPPPPHPSFPVVNSSQPQPQPPHQPQTQTHPHPHPHPHPQPQPQPQPPLGQHPEEPSYIPPQTYPPNIRPPHSQAVSGAPPSQQFYGPPTSMYEPPSSRPGPGYPGSYGPPSGPVEPYPYSSSPSQFGGGSPLKPQHHSSPAMGQSGGSGYPQLPTARILPQALPTASAVGSGSSSSGTGNRVPIDDVVDKVTNMGFPRDQVRATVRKLTENGQSVDLNVVLDKLMNEGDGQPPHTWYNR